MSVSLYRGEVDRLTKETADLQRKAADERSRASRERGEALRKRSSIRGTSSESLIRSRLRDVQRHEQRALEHERRAAEHESRAAAKQRSLASAQKNLDRALADERRREDREAKRRRDDDLRRLRELEVAHRAAQTVSSRLVGPLAPAVQHAPSGPIARDAADFEYDVCLSFAGEERTYVEMIAAGLKAHGLRVFYDADEEVTLWGKDLAEHFDYVYRKASRYCVMFVSEAYAKKPWARHERRSALARAIEEEGEYILPARFDDTELDGLRPTIKWVDLRQIAPETLIEFVIEKVTGRSG